MSVLKENYLFLLSSIDPVSKILRCLFSIMFRIRYRCGEEYKHDESHVGLKFKCTKCGKLHKVKPPSANNGKSFKIRFHNSISRIFIGFKARIRSLKTRKKLASKNLKHRHKTYVQNEHFALNSKYSKIVLYLAKKAWLTSENKIRKEFFLTFQTSEILTLEQTVEKMLEHARKFAPGLEVPLLTPKVENSSTQDQTAGCFQVDEHGYASIKVDQQFMDDRSSTLAILSHEICHYILENSGIRKANTYENEIQTDICMFVIGFGELFLRGYKRDLAMSNFRMGHKLGYLEDQEYWNLNRYVRNLRTKNDHTLNLPSENENLKLIISRMVMGDQRIVDRYISAYEKKFSQLSEKERLEKIIRDIKR